MTTFVNKEGLAGRAKKPGRKVLLSITCVLIAVALTSPVVFSQAKVGTTGAQFLELGVSSRAMAMGEAYTAVVDDISAVYYNPAAGMRPLLPLSACRQMSAIHSLVSVCRWNQLVALLHLAPMRSVQET